jgi:ParB family transcriptional regulator, chromosome partitioning protein
MTVKKRGLAKGRGLDALLGSIQKEKLQLEAQALDHGQLKQIDVHLLQRGEYQPRRFIQLSKYSKYHPTRRVNDNES